MLSSKILMISRSCIKLVYLKGLFFLKVKYVTIKQYYRLSSWKHSHSKIYECNLPIHFKSLQDTRLN